MLFVRLFIVMGAAWIMEGLSFVISPENDIRFFTIFDFFNALQGPIIFLSFIMKRRVLLLMMKRSVTDSNLLYHHLHQIKIILISDVLLYCNFRYREFFGKPKVQTDISCDNSFVKLKDFNLTVFDANSTMFSSNSQSRF